MEGGRGGGGKGERHAGGGRLPCSPLTRGTRRHGRRRLDLAVGGGGDPPVGPATLGRQTVMQRDHALMRLHLLWWGGGEIISSSPGGKRDKNRGGVPRWGGGAC